ncbi:MAG: class I SAM-dependent methyltransferase [Cyanobacteriota bacterium]
MSDISLWDKWNASGGPQYPHNKVVQFFFRLYPNPSERSKLRALDLGCGGGVHTEFLASEGVSVFGSDLSSAAIEVTSKKLLNAGLSASGLSRGSVEAIDAPNGFFDVVICVGVLECVDCSLIGACLSEVVRVLRSNGSALLIFASDQDFRVLGDNPYQLHGYSDEEVLQATTALSSNLKYAWLDRYITTYRGQEIQQNEHLLTLVKK